MCEPTTIALVATAVIGAYSAYKVDQNAKKQERAIRKSARAQEEQIYDQKSIEANQRVAQARRERARLRAASAESGLSGTSIENILDNVDFQASQDVGYINLGAGNALNASLADQQTALTGIRQADWVGTGLQIASAGAGYYAQANTAQSTTTLNGSTVNTAASPDDFRGYA